MATPIRYKLFRDLTPTSQIAHDCPEEPIVVMSVLDEEKFKQGIHIHMSTVFFEDRIHDWSWDNGKFRYFGRKVEGVPVAVVFEQREIMKFDPETGKPL